MFEISFLYIFFRLWGLTMMIMDDFITAAQLRLPEFDPNNFHARFCKSNADNSRSGGAGGGSSSSDNASRPPPSEDPQHTHTGCFPLFNSITTTITTPAFAIPPPPGFLPNEVTGFIVRVAEGSGTVTGRGMADAWRQRRQYW